MSPIVALAFLPAALKRVVGDGAGWPVPARPESPPGLAELQPGGPVGDVADRGAVSRIKRPFTRLLA